MLLLPCNPRNTTEVLGIPTGGVTVFRLVNLSLGHLMLKDEKRKKILMADPVRMLPRKIQPRKREGIGLPI